MEKFNQVKTINAPEPFPKARVLGLPITSASNATEHGIIMLYLPTQDVVEPARVRHYCFLSPPIVHESHIPLSDPLDPAIITLFQPPHTLLILYQPLFSFVTNPPLIFTSPASPIRISQCSCNHVEGRFLGRSLGTDLWTPRASTSCPSRFGRLYSCHSTHLHDAFSFLLSTPIFFAATL